MCLQFISAIEGPLKAAGYNVQVVGVSAVMGSIVVTSTTEFLDGSTTGASDFVAALKDSTSVAALFPASVYGVATVQSVTTASVSNPSKSFIFCRSHFDMVQIRSIVLMGVFCCRWSRTFRYQCITCGRSSSGDRDSCSLDVTFLLESTKNCASTQLMAKLSHTQTLEELQIASCKILHRQPSGEGCCMQF